MPPRESMETIYLLAVITVIILAGLVLVMETRPMWAQKRFIYEGNLTSHTMFEGFHVFSFGGNTTITEKGWLWKTYLPMDRNVVLYKKAGALIVEERTPAAIA